MTPYFDEWGHPQRRKSKARLAQLNKSNHLAKRNAAGVASYAQFERTQAEAAARTAEKLLRTHR